MLSGVAFTLRDATAEDLPVILELWTAMMREHEAFDGRVRLAEGADAAYRTYLGYHIKNEESRLGWGCKARAARAKCWAFAW